MSDLIHHFQLHFWNAKADFQFDARVFLASVAVGIFISAGAIANGLTGKVSAVIDGNTIEVSDQDNQIHKVLLDGIDSPELGQEYGDQAKKFLEKMILEKNVTVQFQGKDRFGNNLAIVMINGKIDPRVDLLKEGLAWTSEKNPSADLESYRTLAQRKCRGLWSQENPVPPWTYRRQQTMLTAKSS